jgi:hypothetical protein
MCLMHGDDFLMAGRTADLEWTRDNLQKDILLSDKGRLGGGRDEVREIKCLNRVLRGTPTGYEIEADPRHAEILIASLGTQSRSVVTPGVKETVTAKRGSVRPAAEENATEFTTRISAKAAKVEDLHRQIRDLAAQLEEQRTASANLAACTSSPPPPVCAVAVSAATPRRVGWGKTEVHEHVVAVVFATPWPLQ